jgi:hypothetical protein
MASVASNRLRKAVTGQFLQAVLHGGPCPMRAVAINADPGRQFVGGFEPNTPDVVGQLIGVGFNLGDCFVAVGAVDPHCPATTYAVLAEEEHDLADFLLLFPALADSLEPSLAN